MSRSFERSGATYRSRVDTWLGVALVLSFAVGIFGAIQLVGAESAGDRLMGVVTLLILGAVGSLVVPVRYRITDRDLVIRSGVRRLRVPLDSIERVTPSRSVLASPALSLDRLAVRYRTGRFAAPEIHISPDRRERFLAQLAAAAGLRAEGDTLVRPEEGRETARG